MQFLPCLKSCGVVYEGFNALVLVAMPRNLPFSRHRLAGDGYISNYCEQGLRDYSVHDPCLCTGNCWLDHAYLSTKAYVISLCYLASISVYLAIYPELACLGRGSRDLPTKSQVQSLIVVNKCKEFARPMLQKG